MCNYERRHGIIVNAVRNDFARFLCALKDKFFTGMRRTKAELPRLWRIILLLLLFAVSLKAEEKEYPAFTTHLDADESSVEFRSWLWMLEGESDLCEVLQVLVMYSLLNKRQTRA